MIDIEKILSVLPHRYPFLLVDRIVEHDWEARTCVGIKCVSVNEPFFQGHYPGKPIMPGVLILEALAQCGAVVMLLSPEHEGKVPLIGAIDNVKYKRMVIPGDVLRLECAILWMRGSIGRVHGEAKVDGELAAVMDMTFKLSARDA